MTLTLATILTHTVTYRHIILTIVPNSLYRFCTSESTWHLLIFIEYFFLMAGAASQAGDADSSRASGLTSGLLGFHECPPWCSIVDATVTVHQFFCILHCQKSNNCNSLKTVSRNLNFVNAISIVYEISGITLKMVCKMTFNDYYRF